MELEDLEELEDLDNLDELEALEALDAIGAIVLFYFQSLKLRLSLTCLALLDERSMVPGGRIWMVGLMPTMLTMRS